MADADVDSADASRQPTPPIRVSKRREAEFRRYAEAVHGLRIAEPASDSQHAPLEASSSADVSLTAFAQLVALRVNYKRALISLFDHTYHYIIAEATQSLSLQHDQIHHDRDALFWGKSIVRRRRGYASLTEEVLKAVRNAKLQSRFSSSDLAVTIPNVLDHEQYATHPHVQGEPFLRAYAGVPLLTTSGYPIGVLSVLNDVPHAEGLNQVQLKFMHDIATSVMNHLDMKRTQAFHQRSTRLVRGLSRFIEGKSSLEDEDPISDDDQVESLSQRQKIQSDNLGASQRIHAMNTATNAERITEAQFGGKRKTFHDTQQVSEFQQASVPSESGKSHPTGSTEPLLLNDDGHERKTSPSPSETSQLQEGLVSKHVPQTFERAGKIIVEAMDVAAAVFVEASFGELGNPDRFAQPKRTSLSTDASVDGIGPQDAGKNDSESDENFATKNAKACSYLARVYTDQVPKSGRKRHSAVPVKFLESIMKRNPYGSVYNFDERGAVLSDDGSDTTEDGADSTHTAGENTAATIKGRKHADMHARTIRKLFPHVRSIAVVPMWHSLRGRYYASAVIWSYNPHRIFTYQDDLNYLGGICDVIMAEVSRLDAQADVQAKNNFISSISHELRSPLHGILGGVEIMQQDLVEGRAVGTEIVQMVDSSGRSLLDIINNLLEHSHVQSSKTDGNPDESPTRSEPMQPVQNIVELTEEVLSAALWATPLPTIASPNVTERPPEDQDTLKVVFDVDDTNVTATGWLFRVNAGSWRRIVQNLTANAIKYTDKGGFFRVELSLDHGNEQSQEVLLKCSDSGRGMSEAFQRTNLWRAFSQEDSHSSGFGLGLSLVSELVKDMGGVIDVQSVQGKGTTIEVRLPLVRGTYDGSGHTAYDERKTAILGSLLTYRLIGLEAHAQASARNAESHSLLRHSIIRWCDFLGMSESIEPISDSSLSRCTCIMTEQTALSMVASASSGNQRSDLHDHRCVVLCDSVISSRIAASACAAALPNAQFVSQPLGPTRFSEALKALQNGQKHTHLSENRSHDHPRTSDPTSGPTSPVTPGLVTSTEKQVADAARDASLRLTSVSLESSSQVQSDIPMVLLVDDNPVNIMLLQRYMRKLSLPHVSATNGREALETYQTSRNSDASIRVVFMDINMPVMDGLECGRRIRALERDEGLKPAVIVALTALSAPTAQHDAYSSGMNIFLTKPVRFREIQQLFETWSGNPETLTKDNGIK